MRRLWSRRREADRDNEKGFGRVFEVMPEVSVR